MTESEAQIDACGFLFLTDIQELAGNGLRIVVYEGRPTDGQKTLRIGDSKIDDCIPIEVTRQSFGFEIEWPHYVAYAVLNESFASPPGADQSFAGRRFRIYTKSHFTNYLSRSTFANDEYPGPLKHFEICCEDQIVNIVSTFAPSIAPAALWVDTARRPSLRT
jgi:hypothetical protein